MSASCNTVFRQRLTPLLSASRESLKTLSTPVARRLTAALDESSVLPLPFCAMTHEEYTELRKYHSFAASLGTSDAVYRALRAADEAVLGDVEDAFFGFQWDNRLFLSTAANKANEFLGTLAHESEHVFRRAHLADYTEPSVLCREEFAAYGAEILLRKETLSKRDAAKIHARLRSLFDLSALQPDSCDKR